jgi:hypothetical protein
MNSEPQSRRDFLAVSGLAGLSAFSLSSSVFGAAASNYQKKVLAKKPVAYWRLGEAKGPAALDSAANKHHGTYQGTPTLGQKGAIRGDTDTAITLDGKRSYVEIPDHADFSVPTSRKGLTVEAWMRPDALAFEGATDDPYIFWLGKGEGKQQEWAFRFYSQTTKRPNRISAYIFNLDGGLGSGAYFEDKLKVGEWLHVVACFDPGDKTNPNAGVSIYKNGELRKGPGIPGSKGTLYATYDIVPAHGKAPLRLGTRDVKTFLTGGLDEVAIYPRVLTAAEVLDHFKTGSKGG